MTYRYEKILTNPVFVSTIRKIEEMEKDRFYCRHGMEHLISVARISYIISLEEQAGLSKDIIYAAALLHDIGRATEYETGSPHNSSGAETAKDIMYECGYSEEEITVVTDSIRSHGHKCSNTEGSALETILCRADKLSRTCFNCKAYESCNWTPGRKNNTLVY